MNDVENKSINNYYKKSGKKSRGWTRYFDVLFFVWTCGNSSLQDFLQSSNNFTTADNMRSNITFDTDIYNSTVNFLDINITFCNGTLSKSLETNPADAHLYLNSNSCHPPHNLNNMPKGYIDFVKYDNILADYFLKRGYHHCKIDEAFTTVKNMTRNELLQEKQHQIKDSQSILVCIWHPLFRKVPYILHQNYRIIENDIKLSKIFPNQPTVAFRRKKTIGTFERKKE